MDLSTEDSSDFNNKTRNKDIGEEEVFERHIFAKGLNHLSEHDYYINTKLQNHTKPKQKKKRNHSIKITQLKAVYNCKSCAFRTMDREIFSKHNCIKIKTVAYINKTVVIPDGYEKCPKCLYFNKNPASMKIHMHIHDTGNPYKCSECGFSGTDLQSLIDHYGTTKNLNCDCGYRTHVKQYFESHLRLHTGAKPYTCGVCCFASSNRAGLSRHLKKHVC